MDVRRCPLYLRPRTEDQQADLRSGRRSSAGTSGAPPGTNREKGLIRPGCLARLRSGRSGRLDRVAAPDEHVRKDSRSRCWSRLRRCVSPRSNSTSRRSATTDATRDSSRAELRVAEGAEGRRIGGAQRTAAVACSPSGARGPASHRLSPKESRQSGRTGE
jgi:hypothetical protein